MPASIYQKKIRHLVEHYVEAEGEGDDEKGVPRQEEDEAFQHLTSEQHENKLSFKFVDKEGNQFSRVPTTRGHFKVYQITYLYIVVKTKHYFILFFFITSK